MSLKLIREANVLSTLDAPTLAAFREIQKATGRDNLADIVVEAFRPTTGDYRAWLRTIIGYAKDFNQSIKDSGDTSESPINLNSANAFKDVAGAVLENDPKNPPVEMHAAILNKLWADYKASKQHAKVQKLARAQEEEELDSVDDIGDIGNPHEPGQRSNDDDSYNSTGRFGVADHDDDDADEDGVDDHEVVCPKCGCEFDPEAVDEPEEGDDEYHEPEDDQPGGSLGSRVGGAERIGKMGNGPDGGHVGDEDLAYQEEELVPRVRRGPMTARVGEEVRSPDSMLRQVLTAPREHVTAALKNIETDGAAAWKASKLPENPHAKGSMAHRKWAAGFKKAMKSHLGLDAVPTLKPKKR